MFKNIISLLKILVIDEGTSAVDPYTDELIQKLLRTEATRSGTTIFCIAHRLLTIVDFDRILVLDKGQVAEFDKPEALLANQESIFAQMMMTQK